MSDVFLSYAREDSAEAEKLALALSRVGLSVFWDRKIAAGKSFEDVVEIEIGAARVVVVLWSRHSVRSEWVRAEAAEGASRGVLVPASLDGVRAPIRYRVTQTTDLIEWTQGNSDEAFATFIEDITRTVRSSGATAPDASPPSICVGGGTASVGPRSQADSTRSAIHRFLTASLVFAWIGSIALAVTAAYDYGAIRIFGFLHVLAYRITLLSLMGGGLATAILGGMSLRMRFLPGVLQGWVWPVVGAVAQLFILVNVNRLIDALPVVNELEALTAFVICGSIAPGLLTVGAIATRESLAGRPRRGSHPTRS